jgi:hypothetical protein
MQYEWGDVLRRTSMIQPARLRKNSQMILPPDLHLKRIRLNHVLVLDLRIPVHRRQALVHPPRLLRKLLDSNAEVLLALHGGEFVFQIGQERGGVCGYSGLDVEVFASEHAHALPGKLFRVPGARESVDVLILEGFWVLEGR